MHASEDLRRDKEVVLTAVRSAGNALRYAAAPLKGDKEVVLAAVAKDPIALQSATEALTEDKDIVLAAVNGDGRALWLAGDDICNDREVVLAAIHQCPDSFEVAGEAVQADEEVVRAAVLKSNSMFRWASKELRSNREFVRDLVSEQGKALEFASPELHRDPELVLLAVRSGARSILRWSCTSELCTSSAFRQAESSCLAAVGQRGVHLFVERPHPSARTTASASSDDLGDMVELRGIWGLDSGDHLVCTVPTTASIEEVATAFQEAQERRSAEALPPDRKIVFRVEGKEVPISPFECHLPWRNFFSSSASEVGS